MIEKRIMKKARKILPAVSSDWDLKSLCVFLRNTWRLDPGVLFGSDYPPLIEDFSRF